MARTSKALKPSTYKYVLGILPFVIIIGGQFFPLLGVIMFGCMALAVGISLFKGRYFCGKLCPRGAFFDTYLRKLSRNKAVPEIFGAVWFRVLWVLFLMGMMGFRVYRSGGDIYLLGSSMVQMIMMTVVIGVLLGLYYDSRVWCRFCPMGTMTNWIGGGKDPIAIDAQTCVDCSKCYRVCPMDIRANYYKDTGDVSHSDCIKCEACVVSCPKKSLSA